MTRRFQKRRHVYASALLCAASGLAVVSTVRAQAGAPQEDARDERVEEIVVTTRKKAENLQEVPLAITAFGADDLEKRSIQSLSDVALQTPGLSFESFSTGTYGTPVIRGLSQTDITSPLPNVSTFVDGIYLQRPYSVDLGVFDIERIEVVKGPQSALYGRNAFAGVINYVTRRPAREWGFDASLTLGSDERKDVTARMDLPLSDWAGIAVTMAHTQFDGTWPNNYPDVGSINADLAQVGGYDNKSYGMALDLEPRAGTVVSLAYYDLDKRSEAGANYFRPSVDQTNPTTGDCGPASAPTRFICSELSTDPLTYASPNSQRLPGIVLDPQAQFTNTTTRIWRAGVTQDIGDAVTVAYQFGRVEAEAFSIVGADWDPLNPALTAIDTLNFAKGPAGRNEIDSHDLRIDWELATTWFASAGVYYASTRDRSVGENIFVPLDTPLATVDVGNATTISDLPRGLGGSTLNPVSFVLEDGHGDDDTYSAFGALTWTGLDDRLRITGEARYTREDRSARWQLFSAQLGDFVQFSGDDSFYQFAPRLSVDYKLTDDNQLYASGARGIKSGGFNYAAALPEEQTYGPEENWTYEIGSKNQFLDGRLTLNLAAFYVDWTDMAIRIQSTPPPGSSLSGSISQIIGSATSYGLEVDGSWLLTDSLTLNYGFSWNRPEFADGVKGFRAEGLCAPDGDLDGRPDGGAPCLLLNDPATGKDFTPLGGNTLPRTPTSNGNLGLQWDGSTGLGAVFVRGDLVHQSKQYVEEFNLATIEPRTLLNASAGLSADTWRVQVWAKNLLDAEYVSNSFFIYIPNLGSATYVPSLGEQRTFGVTARVNFR